MNPSYDICRYPSSAVTNCVVAHSYGTRQRIRMMDTDELLDRLEAKKVRNVEIARALNLPDSRVPEIKRRERKLSLDEGVKLIRAFGLELDCRVQPLPQAVYRLVVRHVARALRVETSDEQLRDLTEDLSAFAEFVSDPKVRKSLDAAEAFFQAMHLRRPKSAEEAEPQSDPHRAR